MSALEHLLASHGFEQDRPESVKYLKQFNSCVFILLQQRICQDVGSIFWFDHFICRKDFQNIASRDQSMIKTPEAKLVGSSFAGCIGSSRQSGHDAPRS